MEHSHWQSQGRCAGKPPGLFFPEKRGELSIPIAKRICGKCAVRGECLQVGLESPELQGIWGGTTEWERDTMRIVLGSGLRQMLDNIRQQAI